MRVGRGTSLESLTWAALLLQGEYKCLNTLREVLWQEHGTRFESVFFQALAVKEGMRMREREE